MTLEEMQAKKLELENKIAKLVHEFIHDTAIKVVGVEADIESIEHRGASHEVLSHGQSVTIHVRTELW